MKEKRQEEKEEEKRKGIKERRKRKKGGEGQKKRGPLGKKAVFSSSAGLPEPLCPQPGCMFFHLLSSFQGFRIALYLQNSQGLSPFAHTISYSLLSSKECRFELLSSNHSPWGP